MPGHRPRDRRQAGHTGRRAGPGSGCTRRVCHRSEVRQPFGPGDILHVPAGVEHRFEEFTDDFATWVVFYGPEGGEETS